MRTALLIFTAFIALAYGTAAQQPQKPATAPVAQTAATPEPTPLPPLKLQGEALAQLALAETQVDSARNALQAAELNLEVRRRQLLESLGGSSIEYDTRPQAIAQGVVAFLPRAKK